MIEIPTGTEINGAFKIVRPIGEGGMGAVYEAKQLDLDRSVALKFLLPELVSEKNSLLRFERESKMMMTLSHPNVVKCYVAGIWQARFPFIVMELLSGRSLKNLIEEVGQIDPELCIKLALQACDGLDAIHKANFTHRDIKPENIFLEDRDNKFTVKIIDFGLAGIVATNATEQMKLTQTGALVGSVFYLSPELCQGRKPDERSDIYSLGCVIYQALTGEPPLLGTDPIALVYKHVHDYPAKLSQRLPGKIFPSGLEDVLSKAMCKDPANRYSSAAALRSDLALVSTGNGAQLEIPDIQTLEASQSKKNQYFIIRPVLLVLTIITTGLMSFYLCSDDALIGFGNTFRSIKNNSVAKVLNYGLWLGKTGHKSAEKRFLLDQSHLLRPGSGEHARLLLELSKIDDERNNLGQKREFLTRVILELAQSIYSSEQPVDEEYSLKTLNEAITECQALVNPRNKASRWYFDRTLREMLELLINRSRANSNLELACELRRLTLLDGAVASNESLRWRLEVSLAHLLREGGHYEDAKQLLAKVRDELSKRQTDPATSLAFLSEDSRAASANADWPARRAVLEKAVAVSFDALKQASPGSPIAVPTVACILPVIEELYLAHMYEPCNALAKSCDLLIRHELNEQETVLAQLRSSSAQSLAHLNRMDEAIKTAKEINRPTDLSTRHSVLSAVYKTQKDFARSNAELQLALDEAIKNKQPATIVSTGLVLVRALWAAERTTQARQILHKALDFLSPAHPLHVTAAPRECMLLLQEGKLAEAKAIMKQAIESQSAVKTDSAASALGTLRIAYAELLYEARDYERCSALLSEMQLTPLSPFSKVKVGELRARSMVRAGKLNDALMLCRESLRNIEAAGCKGDISYMLSMASLVEALARTGQLKQAALFWNNIEKEVLERQLLEVHEIEVARAGAVLSALSGDAKPAQMSRELLSRYGKSAETVAYKRLVETNLADAQKIKQNGTKS